MPDATKKVAPRAFPRAYLPCPQGAARNRLGLALWLASPENPLTARVIVNRIWQHHFGTGLVKTADNFGRPGESPSHPELLDWLATELVRTGWDLKAMHKLIVTSSTYTQASTAKPALIAARPRKSAAGPGPRFRLPAEVVRDNALAISGLLVRKIGGPSIKPYQPAGLWEELAGLGREGPYAQDKGAKLYGRSLYIYRKRTVPHPAMTTFDAPSHEICQVTRARTNTPLQALALLNDVTYVEAAQPAQLALTQAGSSPEECITFAFRRAVRRIDATRES